MMFQPKQGRVRAIVQFDLGHFVPSLGAVFPVELTTDSETPKSNTRETHDQHNESLIVELSLLRPICHYNPQSTHLLYPRGAGGSVE